MKDSELKFAIEDLILVSVPSAVSLIAKDFEEIKESDKNIGIPQGCIKELAILNKDKTRIMLVRDFETKKSRPIDGIVEQNTFKEYHFETLKVFKANFQKISGPVCNKIVFENTSIEIPKEEIETGMPLSTLKLLNQKIISSQLQNFIEEFHTNSKLQAKKAYLKKCQEQYLNF